MFETFDHTADVGLRMQAATREELFVEAARGLMSLLVENPDDIRPTQVEVVTITGKELDYLLFDWLNELLFRFESAGFLGREFSVQINDETLTASIRGETCDRSRHRLAHEVKAITYHGLSVTQLDSVWTAELVLDI